MTTFEAGRAERFVQSLQSKPASRLVLNITLEHDWMLKKQEEIVRDLLLLLQRYPAGTYQVGVQAHRVQTGKRNHWSYSHVGLKQAHNVMTAFPFYIGQVIKK
jgi:hypothetical protein